MFEPIVSLIPPQNTHPHTHTPVPGPTPQYLMKAPTLAWLLSLLLLLAAIQRGAFLVPPANSVYYTMSAARGIDAILPTTATPAVCSDGGSRAECNAMNVALAVFGYVQRLQSAWTTVRHARSTRCLRRTHKAQSFQPTFDCHMYGSPPSHQPPPERAQRDPDKSSRKKSSRRRPFSTQGY